MKLPVVHVPCLAFFFVALYLSSFSEAFQVSTFGDFKSSTRSCAKSTRLYDSETIFEVELNMPPSNSGNRARLKFPSILSVPSELVEVRYALPFGLDVAPFKNLAVCTKDGAGGEKAGDVLRYSSQWTMGLPSGEGLAATAAFTGIGMY